MKKLSRILTAVLAALLLFAAVGCAKKAEGLWNTALYTQDTTLGTGSKTITVVVEAEEKKVTFTVKTDAATVGDALLENKLVEGDMGEYGLYVKKVNGMLADYDVNQTYWAFNINGEMAMTGVDMTELTDGGSYELVLSK